MMIRKVGLILVFGFAMLLNSCANERSNSSETSSFQIQLPHNLKTKSVSALAASRLQFAVINISAPGITPEYWRWKACEKDCLSAATVPAFKMRKGSQILIQLFATYSDSVTEDIHVYYAEASKTLVTDTESIDLRLEKIPSTGPSGDNVLFGGRYMDSLDSGPTGPVDMIFHPPVGKSSASMKLGTESMLNGYFIFPLVAGALVTYEHNGTKLFDSYGAGVLDTQLDQQLLKVNYPAFSLVAKDSNGLSTISRSISFPTSQYVGVFGPTDLSGHRACYNSPAIGKELLSRDFHDESQNLIGSVGVYREAAGTNLLLWNGTSNDGVNIFSQSGVASDQVSICTDESSTHPKAFWFDPEGFEFGGIFGTYGFNGPFAMQHDNGPKGFVEFNYDSSSQALSLSWEYIRGIQSGARGIDGVAVFKSSAVTAAVAVGIGQNSQLNCEDLSHDNTHGFQLAAEVTGTSHIVSPFTVAEFANTEFLFCPFWNNGGVREYINQSVDLGMRHSADILENKCVSGCGGFAASSGAGIKFTTIAGQLVDQVNTVSSPFLAETKVALLHSDGSITNGAGSLFTTNQSDPTAMSILKKLYDDAGEDIAKLGHSGSLHFGTGFSGAANLLSPLLVGIAYNPAAVIDTSLHKVYGLLHDGRIVEVSDADGSMVPITSCIFDSCTIPKWMQSFSIGQNGEIYSLDQAGNRYSVSAGIPTSIGDVVSPRVTQVVYF